MLTNFVLDSTRDDYFPLHAIWWQINNTSNKFQTKQLVISTTKKI